MILIIFSVFCFIFGLICVFYRVRINTQERDQYKLEIDKLKNNKKILDKEYISYCNEIQKLKLEYDNVSDTLSLMEKDKDNLKILIEQKKEYLDTIQKNAETALNSQKTLVNQAYQSYYNVLNNKYSETEKQYETLNENLQKAYTDRQNKLIEETQVIEEELDKIRATRAASIDAVRREREIKEQSTFYCLQISDEDKADIKRLIDLRMTFNHPRVISKLIWSDFIQKDFKALGIKILGSSEPICGIYKITSLLTGECYVGQSVNILDRWQQHGKAGCGIDTPPANKLYKAINEDGIWNFSWELLEKCPREQLDEKEKFYIDLYQADRQYNSTKGNN